MSYEVLSHVAAAPDSELRPSNDNPKKSASGSGPAEHPALLALLIGSCCGFHEAVFLEFLQAEAEIQQETAKNLCQAGSES